MVEKLCSIYDTFHDKKILAIIGSNFCDTYRPIPETTNANLNGNLFDQDWQEVDWVITSGSLLNKEAYLTIGLFREDYFIDFVDKEYCLRAEKYGYKIIKIRSQLMFHTIGKSTQHNIFGKHKWTTNHTADRRYYMTRNHIAILREYFDYKHRLGWLAIKGFSSCFKSFKRIILHEDMKREKIIALIQGWWDGVNGKMGARSKRDS